MQVGDQGQRRLFGHWWANTLVRVVLRALIQAGLVLAILVVNPFEITRWTELRNQDLWERIQAPSYHNDVGRGAVSIVYLDEETLADAGWTRPITLREHEAMLDDVTRANRPGQEPAAVFIDFALDDAATRMQAVAAAQPYRPADLQACARAPASPPPGQPGPDRFRCYLIKVASLTHYHQWADDPACGTNDLARILCIRRSGGIPIIFPTGDKPDAGAGSSPTLRALSQVALVTSAVVSTANEYWLVTPGKLADRQNQPFHLSPAAALYAVFCYDQPQSCRLPPIGAPGVRPPEWTKAFEQPVQVRWGLGTDDAFTRRQEYRHSGAMPQRCIVGDGMGGDVKEAGKLSMAGFNGQARKLGCAFTHATPYTDFDAANTAERDLEDIASGKLVLVGGQFSDSNDWISAPPQGQLPGVYYHAMALDNLIKFGPDYPAVPQPWWIFSGGWNDLLTVAMTFLAGFVITSLRVWMNEPHLDPAQSGHERMSFSTFLWTRPGRHRFGWFAVGLALLAVCIPWAWLCASNTYNSSMLVLVLLAGLPGLMREWLRPLIKGPRPHPLAEFLDVGDARWFEPDLTESNEGTTHSVTEVHAFELIVKEDVQCSPKPS